MRILAITSAYPPDVASSYPHGAHDLVETLRGRGHVVRVLTARSSAGQSSRDGAVDRLLRVRVRHIFDWRAAVAKEAVNQKAFRHVAAEFRPDIVLLFDPSQVSISLVTIAAELGLPVCCYLATDWFAIWEKDDWAFVWPKEAGAGRAVRHFARQYGLVPPDQRPRFGHAIFANQFLRDLACSLGMAFDTSAVVPWGLDLDRFPFRVARPAGALRILTAGDVRADKQFNVVVEAVARLKEEGDRDGTRFTLTVVGRDPSIKPDWSPWLDHLRGLVYDLGISTEVIFRPAVPREEMPAVYAGHDVFVRTDAEQGASSLALLEAMACGLPIVARRTRGNGDVLRDGDNALLFDYGNAGDCARLLSRLATDPALFESLRASARRTVERDHRLDDTAGTIERVLTEAVRGHSERNRSGGACSAVQQAEQARPLRSFDTPLDLSLDRLEKKVRGRLRPGKLLVRIRKAARPAFLAREARRAVYRMTATPALHACPRVLDAVFALAGRRPARKDRRRTLQGVKSVLVVQPADMGDLLLSAPLLRELRRALPSAWIGLALLPSMIPVVKNCPYVDDLIPYPWRSFSAWGDALWGHPRWWLQGVRLSLKRLRKRRVDLAVSARWNDDATQAAALTLMFASGAPRRVGYMTFPDEHFDMLLTGGPIRRWLKHEVEIQLNVLRWLGVPIADEQLELWTSPEDDASAASILREAGADDGEPLVAFAPGARWEMRRWPIERFIALGRRLQEERGLRIVLLASPDERELTGRVAAGLHQDRTVNLAGRTSILGMAAVLRRCRLFVGNDSGPLHVAVAAGVPTVGIYGPGEFERFRPWGAQHRPVTLGLSCSPCSQNCAFNDPRCIRGIPTEMVWNAVTDVLGA